MIKLSIIIPYYNTLELTKKLMKVLIPLITDEVEVILIDDGCFEKELANFEKINVIHQDNGGVSNARNTGLEFAKGEYIAFIDTDDLITKNYVKKILDKIKEDSKWDYCHISWKSNGTIKGDFIIKTNPPKWNTCVWNTIYKKSIIGRFNENKSIAEDEEFNLTYRKGKRANILDILYIYNSGRTDSLTQKNMKKAKEQTE
jgi:glycosyltransferase involved in cell wall biosynthesis